MYHPHDTLWLLPFVLGFWVVCAVSITLVKRNPPKAPRWLPIAAAVGFVGCLLTITLGQDYDEMRQRQELRGLDAAQVAHLTLSRAGKTRQITDRESVAKVMSELQADENIPAHHSSREDFVDITFEYHGEHYHYEVDRDSDRPQEYWIQDGGGRIQSATFGPLIDRLLGQAWQPPSQ